MNKDEEKIMSGEDRSTMQPDSGSEQDSSFILHPSSFSCITCSDEAVECRIVHVDGATQMAVVAVQGAQEEIDISLVDDVAPGDVVLAHGGIAIAKR
jgi:hypothetical protein